ncbi:hypothetical protein [Psittacicella gerlachiana]|uniref:Uncharacterized protein n=1 Tax=Psittacicella gerlachiana TaxID=2028574 RepID=A0A3A1YD05_9GAMM|nr:hypothetical protein [Psittacicella gerlachiana]RIY36032.1 hypothetical protein CKF59_03035 [Psittacicella gerlachiana]
MLTKREYKKIVDRLLKFRFTHTTGASSMRDLDLHRILQLAKELQTERQIFVRLADEKAQNFQDFLTQAQISRARLAQLSANIKSLSTFLDDAELIFTEIKEQIPLLHTYIVRCAQRANDWQENLRRFQNSAAASLPISTIKLSVAFANLLKALEGYAPSFKTYLKEHPNAGVEDYVFFCLQAYDELMQSAKDFNQFQFFKFLETVTADIAKPQAKVNYDALEVLLTSLYFSNEELVIRYYMEEMYLLIRNDRNYHQALRQHLSQEQISLPLADPDYLLYFQENSEDSELLKYLETLEQTPLFEHRVLESMQRKQFQLLGQYQQAFSAQENFLTSSYIADLLGKPQPEMPADLSFAPASKIKIDEQVFDKRHLHRLKAKDLTLAYIQETPLLRSMFAFMGYDVESPEFNAYELLFNPQEYIANGFSLPSDSQIRVKFLESKATAADYHAIKEMKDLAKVAVLANIYQAALYEKIYAEENDDPSPFYDLSTNEITKIFRLTLRRLFGDKNKSFADLDDYQQEENKPRSNLTSIPNKSPRSDEALRLARPEDFASYEDFEKFEADFFRDDEEDLATTRAHALSLQEDLEEEQDYLPQVLKRSTQILEQQKNDDFNFSFKELKEETIEGYTPAQVEYILRKFKERFNYLQIDFNDPNFSLKHLVQLAEITDFSTLEHTEEKESKKIMQSSVSPQQEAKVVPLDPQAKEPKKATSSKAKKASPNPKRRKKSSSPTPADLEKELELAAVKAWLHEPETTEVIDPQVDTPRTKQVESKAKSRTKNKGAEKATSEALPKAPRKFPQKRTSKSSTSTSQPPQDLTSEANLAAEADFNEIIGKLLSDVVSQEVDLAFEKKLTPQEITPAKAEKTKRKKTTSKQAQTTKNSANSQKSTTKINAKNKKNNKNNVNFLAEDTLSISISINDVLDTLENKTPKKKTSKKKN